jgi:ABC-type lipoprotein release transport system permease subunit
LQTCSRTSSKAKANDDNTLQEIKCPIPNNKKGYEMKWLSFAYKNIIRNLRRSLITMLIIAVGTASVLITSGFILYTYDSLREISAHDSGHVVIAHKDYFDKEETALYGLADHKSIKQQIIEQQNEEIRMVIPRLQFSGLITNGDKSVIFTGTGIDPEGEFYVKSSFMKVLTGKILTAQSPDTTIPPNFPLTNEEMAEGLVDDSPELADELDNSSIELRDKLDNESNDSSLIEPRDKLLNNELDNELEDSIEPHNKFDGELDGSSIEFDDLSLSSRDELDTLPQVMLAKELAKQLNAEIGSLLTLHTMAREGVLNALNVRVLGIFTVIPEMDKRLLLVTLPTAQELLRTDKVSTLSVYLYETKNTATQLAALAQQYPKLAIQPWWKQAFFYFKVKALYNGIFGIFGAMILLIVFFALINTLSMMVIERTREIGTLLALGTFPWQIVRNFILEALLIGIAGTLLGMLIAASASISLFFLDVQMPTPFKQLDGYPLYIYMSSWLYSITTLSVIILCIGAAWLASRTAANKPIVESLVR